MEKTIPRVMLAGTNSGCGKTTVTCAVLQALVNRGRKAGAFKCGPDYIDPMFHSRIIGAKSANLDSPPTPCDISWPKTAPTGISRFWKGSWATTMAWAARPGPAATR